MNRPLIIFPSLNHGLLSGEDVDEFLILFRRLLSQWWGRADRLSDTHGDPNPYNINITRDRRIRWLDYGRITRGERGFDVGWLLGEFVRRYHQTRKQRYRELGDYLIEKYQRRNTDEEILGALLLGLSVKFLVHMNPVYTSTQEIALSGPYHRHVKTVMKDGLFYWL